MRVTVSSPIRFVRTPDGLVWARQETDGRRFWNRYLDVFDEVRVLARVAHRTKAPPGWVPASGDGVAVVAVPDYLGPWQLLANAPAVTRAVDNAVQDAEALILRLPCNVGIIAHYLLPPGRPYAVEVVGDPYDALAPHANDDLARPFWRWLLTRRMRVICAGATASSYVTRAALQHRYPPKKASVTTHYSSIELDAEWIASTPRPAGAGGQRRRLIFVGTLEWLYKAPDAAIEAVAICRNRGLDIELAVAGDGRFRGDLEALASRLGVADRVIFHGQLRRRADVMAELDRADLLILPSRQEGLPRAMIEGMARGLPCIGTAVGGTPELLEESCLVPVDDPKALAARVEAVLSDPAFCHALSLRSLRTAREYESSRLRERRKAFYRYVRQITGDFHRGFAKQAAKPPRKPVDRCEPATVANAVDGAGVNAPPRWD